MSKIADYMVNLSKIPASDRVTKVLTSIPSGENTGEIEVGGIFSYSKNKHNKGKRYKVIESPNPGNCSGCDFYNGFCCEKTKHSPCTAYSRRDKTWVHFKEL